MDLPERAKGAMKSNSGLASFAKVALATAAERVYRELGQGSRGARGIYLSRSLFPQKTPGMGVFCYNRYKALALDESLATRAHSL